MHGSIAGDFIGSRFNDPAADRKSFFLLSDDSGYSGITVMTLAMVQAVSYYFEIDHGSFDLSSEEDERKLSYRTFICLRKWRLKNKDMDYDTDLEGWISTGNKYTGDAGCGPAAWLSPLAWLFDDIDTVRKAARISASVTTDDPALLRDAEAAVSAVFLARTGEFKAEIKEYLIREFGYSFDDSCLQIREANIRSQAEASGSGEAAAVSAGVREAVVAFLEGRNCIDVIRNAVALGGKSGSIAAAAGAIANAYFGDDPDLFYETERMLKGRSRDAERVIEAFDRAKYKRINKENYKHINTSRARIRLLPDFEQTVAKHYVNYQNIRKTAESFGMSVEETAAILYKAERYTDRKYREHVDVIEYVNELSPYSLKHGDGIHFDLVCGTWIRNDDALIIDILRSADVTFSMSELAAMTGLSEHRVKHTLNMIRQQNSFAEIHRQLKDTDTEEFKNDEG